MTIASKVGYFAGTARHPYDAAQIRSQFATTLANLGTDHLDLYSLHSTDFGHNDEFLSAAVGVMHELREQGQITAIGMRAPHEFATQWANTDHPKRAQTRRRLDLFHRIRPDVVSTRYNPLSPLYRPEESDIFDFARDHGVGVLVKQAFGQGLLLRHQNPSAPRQYGPEDHRSTDPMFRRDNIAALHARLAPLRARHGEALDTWARLCLRYVLHHAPDSPVLVGFRDTTQIRATVTSLGDHLGADEITEIRSLLHPTTLHT